MRKAILLAMAAAIVAMFAIPGSATAAWTKHHAPIASNFELEITGTDLIIQGSTGGITCHSTISNALFEAGTTTGKITSFGLEAGTQCTGRESLAGCTVSDFTADNLPWVFHRDTGDTVTITTGTITTTMSGFLCPHTPLLTPGTLSMVAGVGQTNTTSTMITGGTFAGDEPAQSISFFGAAHVLGPITYGFGEPIPPPPPSWTKHHVKSGSNFELELTGTDVLIQGPSGGITCHSMTSKVLFEAGSTGKVNTFAPEAGTKCTGTGPFVECTVSEVVADNLPWTIHRVSTATTSITTGTITTKLTGTDCPAAPSWTAGTVHMTKPTSEANTTSTTSLSGELTGDNPSQKAQISGTIHVLGTITYGI